MGENKKGIILYVVLGVATLIVAIIGATFAYFSAQASSKPGDISGGTSDVGSALSIEVKRVLFGTEENKDNDVYKNLVPAQLTVNNDGIAKAVNNKCIANGYTGCHLYKITATSSQDLAEANILLHSFKVEDENQESTIDLDSWKFVVFTGTEAASGDGGATTYTVSNIVTGETAQSFNSDAKNTPSTELPKAGYDINKNGRFTKGEKVYYLLVYLANNEEQVQNPDDKTNEFNAVGTYSGSIAFNAAGGKVVANFTAEV